MLNSNLMSVININASNIRPANCIKLFGLLSPKLQRFYVLYIKTCFNKFLRFQTWEHRQKDSLLLHGIQPIQAITLRSKLSCATKIVNPTILNMQLSKIH